MVRVWRKIVDLADKFALRGATAAPMASHDDKNPKEVHSYSATFTNARGKKIFCKYWDPPQKARALVHIVHGYAEHCLPYDPLARSLAAHNFFVFSHDHVGHGQSGGSRVHIKTFQHYVDDVLQHIDMMKKKFHNLPVFLCGHSMGGAIAILVGLQRSEDFNGVVVIGPAVTTNPDLVTPVKKTMVRMLSWLFPHFPVGKLDLCLCSRCPKYLKTMQEDPLRYHGYAKAAFGCSLLEATGDIHNKIPSITYPLLILQGEDDKLCLPSGAQMLFDNASSKDKSLKVFPKAYHDLLHEPNGVGEEAIEDIIQWFIARV